MVADSGMLIAIMALYAVTSQGDYIILGRMYPAEVVGLYFWAFALSTQSVQMIAQNLAVVLFPSLSRLKDEPARLRGGFVRTLRVLAIVSIPACFLQAALARPAVELLFDARWQEGIVLVQILSVGWALFSTAYVSDSLLKAQGRFWTLLWQWLLFAALFAALVYAGARGWGVRGAAAGVSAYSWLVGPLGIWIALRPMGGRWRDVAGVFAAPIAVGGACVALAALAGWWVRGLLPAEARWAEVVEIGVITLVSAGLYIPAIRRVSAEPWGDLVARLRGVRMGDVP
jgi:PST family polysaccharide transporter